MSAAILDRLAQGPANAAELMAVAGCSQAVLSRRLQALRARVLPMGAARARRYGLLQPVRDLHPEVPVYRVDGAGDSVRVGALAHLAGGQFWFESSLGDKAATRLYADLPWWMQDLRPQGFLGRLLPRRFPGLGLPADIRLWDGATVLYALSRRGDDLQGDLILGDVAYSRWWESRGAPADSRPALERFGALAGQVIAGSDPGSSAGGEQPKFLTHVSDAERGSLPVLVKFSPPRSEAIGQRWSDLLIAEHLALEALRAAGFAAAASTVVQDAARTYLQVERFDRSAGGGRRAVVSLGIADAEFTGTPQPWSWTAAARALARDGRLSAEDVGRIERIAAFGHLIANSDMHAGNLGLFHRWHDIGGESGFGRFALAPVYDMLPMRYAPMAGEVLTPAFTVPAPLGGLIDAYAAMRASAGQYWRTVADDARVSEAFRTVAAGNARRVAAL